VLALAVKTTIDEVVSEFVLTYLFMRPKEDCD
jgi:hypothetical protein